MTGRKHPAAPGKSYPLWGKKPWMAALEFYFNLHPIRFISTQSLDKERCGCTFLVINNQLVADIWPALVIFGNFCQHDKIMTSRGPMWHSLCVQSGQPY